MTSLEELVLALCEAAPAGAGDAAAGLRLEVDAVELHVPIEAHLSPGGRFLACAPRGRYATGFDPPHGALALTFSRGEP